jgi:pimeloyl-ACP methyl ester carboxylesterase
MPPRNPPQPWQLEMMEHPARFGLRIERAKSARGVPYLFCLPSAEAGPGRRGEILRRQLGSVAPCPGRTWGTALLLHGWGMRKESLLAVAERFCAAGLRCVIPDLPGHGENALPTAGFGARDTERLLLGDVLDSASRRFRFPPHPAILWGLSMGGAYALQAAAGTPQQWDGVVIVSSFAELEPVVRERADAMTHGFAGCLGVGFAAAVRWRGGFSLRAARPEIDARRVAMPAFVIHGTADDLIPPASGRRLFAALPSRRKRWLSVAGAQHGNVLGTPQHVFLEMCAWMLGHFGQPTSARARNP